MKLRFTIFAVILLLASAVKELKELDKGEVRLLALREKSLESRNRIITFSKADFDQYVMKYPRPYDVVIYFTARTCKFCDQLYPEYEYLVDLYENVGAIHADKEPVFFAQITHSMQTIPLYQQFGFKGAPNLVVSKPHMAVVSQIQRKTYLQQFKWGISHTDGHVTTHKMLQFVNKRTGKDVYYKPTFFTMIQMFFGFIVVALVGVVVYTKLQVVWNNWVFWLVGSLVIYVTCCSGIIYDIIHDVPLTGRDPKTGETIIFSGGNREQYGLQGWIVSISITVVALLFIAIAVIGERMKESYSALVGAAAILMIWFIVSQLEIVYKQKGWYGPSFTPPGGYISGPLSRDQGNNI